MRRLVAGLAALFAITACSPSDEEPAGVPSTSARPPSTLSSTSAPPSTPPSTSSPTPSASASIPTITTAQRARADRLLLAAAESGDTADAARALRAGARLEARDERRRTPLLLAAANDRIAVARLLVSRGADPDALDDRHDTPWLVTGVTGSVRMLETLLPSNPDLTIRNRFGGLSPIPAAERGHVEYIRRVVRPDLRARIDLDHVNDSGWTALLEAVILGNGGTRHQQVVRALVAAGVDTSIGDRDGVTALQHARDRGYTRLVDILSA